MIRSAAILLLAGTASGALGAPAAEIEDARIERERVLRAADQLDLLSPKIEQIQADLATLKRDLAALREENAALKKQAAAAETARAADREAILDEVARMVAGQAKPAPTSPPPKTHEPPAPEPSPKPAPSSPAPPGAVAPATATPPAEEGFEHVVQPGQTVSAIARAFQQQGVKVSADEIIKANNLGPDARLRVGQKLFIPRK